MSSYQTRIEAGHIPASCPTGAGRFWDRTVIDPSGCWRWTGRPMSTGYGTLVLRGRKVYVHRFAYESFVGPIPDGLVIDHLCRNTLCVNPRHMEPVTNVENALRSPYFDARRRGECRRGHRLIDGNLYVRPDGRRRCLACQRFIRAHHERLHPQPNRMKGRTYGKRVAA